MRATSSLAFSVMLLVALHVYAGGRGGGSPPIGTRSGGPVHVSGYYRKNGTYVSPYTRSAPNRGSLLPVARTDAPNVKPRTEARVTTRSAETPNASLADLSQVRLNGIVTEIRAARVAKPLFVNHTRSKFSKKPLLIVEVAVFLDDPKKSVKFRSFADAKVKLANNKGKEVTFIPTDEEGLWPNGRSTENRELTKGKRIDPLVFEVPEVGCGDLLLELFWDAVGTDPIQFEIPESLIAR